MYLIKKDEELTPDRIGRIINDYTTTLLPRLQKYWNYYNGKQAITYKQATDTGKACNKIVVNYCYSIVENYLGYIAGIPINYDNEDFEEVIDILKWNDVATEDVDLLRQALIYGRAFEVNYIDEESHQRFKLFDCKECIPVYDDTLNNDLLYVIRFYQEDIVANNIQKFTVEVYGPNRVDVYQSEAGFVSFEFIKSINHYYGQCPVTVFSLDSNEDNIFSQILSLQDAYNTLVSGEVDDFDAFADAYLILKGAIADEKDLESMKQHRLLMLDADSDAQYLTKTVADTQVSNMLDNIDQKIHTIANSPDFTDEEFMSQSGIALRYKLIGFENRASGIESQMRKALQRRIELISAILSLTDESLWREVKITFKRNIPEDTENIVDMVDKLRGLVSDETLLGLLPFIDDVDKEMEKIKAQEESKINLYGKQLDDRLLETKRDSGEGSSSEQDDRRDGRASS